MPGFLASSIGVACAAALAVPLAPPATAGAGPGAKAAASAGRPAASRVPGSTQSLPLEPLARDRASGAVVQGLPRRAVRHFSLVGVVWNDPAAELRARVQVRTRAAGTGTWSGWRDVETHNAEHAADPGTAERASGRVRGATAPLWVGDSDGVEIRVRPGSGHRTGGRDRVGPGPGTAPAADPLPGGLRLELVDPGEDAPPADGTPAGPGATATPGTGAAAGGDGASGTGGVPGAGQAASGAGETEALAASAANAGLASLGATEIPELGRAETEAELFRLRADELTEQQRAKPYIGPRPRIVTRRGWGADETLREKGFRYTKKVAAAFVHHTASGNNYRCEQAPSIIRSIYRYHVRSMGWRDIGYNFLVDKCGKIYEGRAGGVAQPVMGAHTLGFNGDSTGIAVLGSFGSAEPPSAAVRSVARLTAWKLGFHGMNPRGMTYLKSAGGNLYRKGMNVRLNVISGHRDGFATECPGGRLYRELGTVRSAAARHQGR
ncbi:peptidoglycan recognition protein [Streptomyces glaucus]